jgi:riboflavin kinase/FMN adenylyltransferase
VTGAIHDLAELAPTPSVVTIGNFDGVHRGHRALLRRTVDTAADNGWRSVALTFDPHPAAVLRPGTEPPRLQPLAARVAALTAAGIDQVVVLPFTRELSARSPEAFVTDVLTGPLDARRVVVGTNFRFGHRAAGDVVALVELGDEHGFSVEAVGVVELDGEALSSTAVRRHLETGDVGWVTRALARPYTVVGEVVHGDGRGRTIGVPTANVRPPADLHVPGDGVYAGHLGVDGVRHPCVTNVGVRPTFDGTTRSVEAHVLDAEVELYGRTVEVSFEHRLRGERRFDGPDALVAQIHHDLDEARRRLDAAAGA